MNDMEYRWDRESIRRWVEVGKKAHDEYDSYDAFVSANINDFPFCVFEMIALGWNNPEWDVPEEETFYRIGEPGVDMDVYYHSYNFMDDKPEDGVSVATAEWMKGTFFDTSDSHIARTGVWEIKGVRLPHKGGDDEPLIIPTAWAKRTGIKTRDGLLKRLSKQT